MDGARRLPPARGRRRLLAVRAGRDGASLSPEGFRGIHALSGARSRTRTASGSVSGRCATRSPSSSPRTSSTAASGCGRSRVRRDLGDGYELDDDPARIDREAVHAYLERRVVLGARAARVRCRTRSSTTLRASSVSTATASRSASRGRSPTATYSRTSRTCTCSRSTAVAGSASSSCASRSTRAVRETKWFLHTRDAHDLYRKFGFTEPSERALERRSARYPAASASSSASSGELVEDEGARARDRDPLLRERVAVADRDRVVLERLLVDRERVRRADLVLAAVAPADLARVVVLGDDGATQLLVQRARLPDDVLVPRDQREHRDLHRGELRGGAAAPSARARRRPPRRRRRP